MRAILTYHSIDASGSPISTDAETFRRHVDWLVSAKVRVRTVAELIDSPPSESAVALTFDDGFANFGELAWPLLRDHGLPVTLFVASDHVGRTNSWRSSPAPAVPELPLLTWQALARLAEEGVEIGSHSRTHPDLRRLSDAALAAEMAGSGERIERATGREPTIFAYPYGHFDARVLRAARASYALACTTELRPLRQREDIHRLPRLDAYYLRDPARLRAWDRLSLRLYLAFRSQARRARQALAGLGLVSG